MPSRPPRSSRRLPRFIALASGTTLALSGQTPVTYSGDQIATGELVTSSPVQFIEDASAGSARLVTRGTLSFTDQTTAANADILAYQPVYFSGFATAGSALITSNSYTQYFFSGDSSAGSAEIRGNSSITFSERANAASVRVVNNQTTVLFQDSVSGGSGYFDVYSATFSGGATAGTGTYKFFTTSEFLDSASAGSATIASPNQSTLYFRNTSTLATATLQARYDVRFADQATAGSGTIRINSGTVYFQSQSSAGSATILNSSGRLIFNGDSTAQNATITNDNNLEIWSRLDDATIFNNGNLTLANYTTPANTARVTNSATARIELYYTYDAELGSLSGGGALDLRENRLTLGRRGDSTEFSGIISSFNSRSVLEKIGPGTLTLSGANTYSGSTLIKAGAIQFTSPSSFGTGLVALDGGTVRWAPGLAYDLSPRLAPVTAAGGGLDTNGNDVTFATALTGAGPFEKLGTGTLTLSAANTHTGGFIVSGGTLRPATLAALGSGPVVVQSGGTLDTAFALDLSRVSGSGRVFGSGPFTYAASSDAVLATALSGSASFAKTGSATLTLTGDNTYTGGTTLSGGTLRLGNGGSSGSLVGDIVNHGTLAWNRSDSATLSGAISGSGALLKTGSGTLTLSAANTYSGGTTVSAGSLVATHANALGGNRPLDVAAGATLDTRALADFSVGSLSGSGHIAAGGGVFSTTQSGDTTWAGVLSGAGRLAMNGTGTLTLSGDNTFTAATFANAGTIVFSRLNNLGLGANFQFGGGTLRWAPGNTTDLSVKNIILNAAGGTIDTHGNNVTFAHSVGGNGPGALVKTGAGSLTLAGDNTYTGGTTVAAGTLVATHANALGVNGALTVASGATLDTRALSSFTVGSLSGSGDIAAGGGVFSTTQTGATTFAGVLSGAGRLAMNGPGTLTLSGDNTFTAATFANAGAIVFSRLNNLGLGANFQFGGGTLRWAPGNTTDLSAKNIILNAAGGTIDTHGNDVRFANPIGGNGAGALTKTGAGTLTLAAANTYTGGTTVAAGTLVANNPTGSATGSGSVTIQTGATLAGSGFIAGPATIASGGTLSPGNSPGTLTFTGGLQLDAGATLRFELGTASDLVRVTGGVFSGPSATGSISLLVTDSGGFAPGAYTLFDFTGATLQSIGATAFAITSAPSGFSYSVDRIDDRFVLTAAAIPEPAACATLAGLAALGLRTLRRRRS